MVQMSCLRLTDEDRRRSPAAYNIHATFRSVRGHCEGMLASTGKDPGQLELRLHRNVSQP